MNFNDLRTFLAVVETESFSRAARQLHITQPAVSKRVQTLEQSLDVQLFDRVGKSVSLTQAGTVLVPQAQKILAMLADTERHLRNLSHNITGTLHLATSHHIGLHRLAPVLRAFATKYPEVQLNISFEDSEVAHDMVRRGDIELAVVTLNPQGDRQLHYEPVWHDTLLFVTAQDPAHSGSDETDNPLDMATLATRPCVLPGTGTYTGRIVLQRFAENGISLSPGMSTNYLETIGMLVSVGLGWSVLPQNMVGDLQIMDIDCPEMSRSLGCVTNPNRASSNAARAFVHVVLAFSDVR